MSQLTPSQAARVATGATFTDLLLTRPEPRAALAEYCFDEILDELERRAIHCVIETVEPSEFAERAARIYAQLLEG